jgi:hypothetical protein
MITVPGSDEFEDLAAAEATSAPAWRYLQNLPQALAGAGD